MPEDEAGPMDEQDATLDLPPPEDPAAPVVASPLAAGDRLGRYIVERALGHGGMSEVYLATDSLLDRSVALKVLRADTSGRSLGERRLLREAQVIARLRHPNIVAIHDVGGFDGRMFLAMEFVQGKTLRRWGADDTPSVSDILDVVGQAGLGLIAAHEADLLHRDIKPDNIMLADDGRVLVLDFGLSRTEDGATPVGLAAGASLVGTVLTRAEHWLGTPRYAAPELMRTGVCSPATDQYALAVTLFELVYGRPPFTGATAEARYAAMQRPLSFPPTDAPSGLAELLRTALHVDPAQRFATVDAFVDRLQRIRRAGRRRTRRVLAAGLLVALAGAAGGGFVAARAEPEPVRVVDRAERLANEATAAAARARYIYPARDDEGRVTAYSKVLELDTVHGPRAAALRGDFARALEALGDRYWSRPGGATFAADFYVQALIFDANAPNARARAAVTVAQLAALQQRAAAGDFSDGELLVADVLAALAEPDPAVRVTRVSALLDDRDATPGRVGLPATTASHLRRTLQGLRAEQDAARDEAVVPDPDPAGATSGTGAEPTTSPDPDATTAAPPPTTTGAPPTEPAAAGDAPPDAAAERRAAKRLVTKGESALRSRRLDEASTHFHAALARDRGNAAALIGLSHVHYENARYADATRYARLAIKAAPKRAGYHLQLGDACFKTHRYDEARTAYQAALDHGHPKAAARLARVVARVGGSDG